jgi:hypothetical protein
MECDFAISLPYTFRLQDNASIIEDLQEENSRLTDLGEATFIYLGYSPW